MRWLLLCSALMAFFAQAETWKVIGDEQFAPYSFISPHNNQPQGLDVEIVKAVLREAKLDADLRLYPWQRLKLMLERKQATMAFPFAGTPERMQQYELVGPIRSGSTVLMARHSFPLKDWQTLEDLKPYRIGQTHGYAYEENFDKAALNRNSNAQTPKQLVSMLMAGRIDIIVGDKNQLNYLVQQQQAQQQVFILPKPLAHMSRYVAFNKGDSSRAKQFADALERLRNNGTLQRIIERWQ